jgi:tetratricopeptide (TPR) repeat protein
MKRVSLLLTVLSIGFAGMAQSIDEARKLLRYGRLQSAEKMFEQLVAANPTDPQANYWLGQLYLSDVPAKINEAKELYAKAITATNQNPLILVGMGHVEMMLNNKESAISRFEQAINATKNRKNKNYGDPAILIAIGRANSTGDSQTGDIQYALQKLAQASELDPKDADAKIYEGIIHLKRGGEYGGQAKRAFEEAIERDPKNGQPYYRIGKIFESQKNESLFLEYYNKAVENDPHYAPAYLSLYDYYKSKDVNKAKSYLDKYMANNDRDLETEFFYADFLFRSGKYLESLQKCKEIEASLKPGEKFVKLNRLYSINYDRLGDSIKAKEYLETYMATQLPELLKGEDYADMAAMYLRFPDGAEKADVLVEKAVQMDTSLENKLGYIKAIADAYAKQGAWKGNYKWLARYDELNPNRTAVTYYYLADAAYKAGDFAASASISSRYIQAYPDQVQGYFLQRRAAVAADPDTSSGSALPAIDQYIKFLLNDVSNNKGRLLENYAYKIYYFLIKSREYDRALEAAEGILAIDPENDYGKRAKSEAERLIKATSGSKNSTSGKSPAATSSTGSGSSGNNKM